MIRKSWDTFNDKGLLWFVNKILQSFGWVIVLSYDDNTNDFLGAWPARIAKPMPTTDNIVDELVFASHLSELGAKRAHEMRGGEVGERPDQIPHGQEALEAALAERQRQLQKWSRGHDDGHDDGQLALAAARYAVSAAGYIPAPECLLNGMGPSKDLWPFEEPYVDRHDAKDRVVKALALLVAEYERLRREEDRADG